MDTLTGDQFAKMLLCGLSLARDGNYAGLGSAWYSAVWEDAGSVKLYDGDASMMTDWPITRQQAALLAWNAIKAAEAAKKPANPTPPDVPTTPTTPQPGGDVETPEIDIDPTPITPEPPTDEQPGNNDDNGVILLPEVP